ncbi:MAG: DNA-binding protein [Acidobacteria bacterium]|nr:DNA-binding protein [Acidobacteriota bacterium]
MSTRTAATRPSRQKLAQALIDRSRGALERIASGASAETLAAALATSSDVAGIAMLLSDTVALEADPLLAAMHRGRTAKQELLRAAGGGLTAAQAARAMGASRQTVESRRKRAAMLAVPTGAGTHVYPACQFGPDGVLAGMDLVLGAFRVHDPWTQLSLLLAPAPALGGRSMLEAVAAGEAGLAAQLAAEFAE